MSKKTHDTIVASSDWTVPADDGVHRRTIVKGAAWTVPVVAMSIATPAAAASNSPTLAFTQASYSGTACGTISGVQVKRTTDGTTADPGKTVTVTLKDGYTFADGKTTHSGTTDANGLLSLPDITVPAEGGDSTFTATSTTLSASAPVKAKVVDGSAFYRADGTTNSRTHVPTKSTAVGNDTFLAPDGSLWLGDGKTAIATKVSKAISLINLPDGGTRVSYVSKGVAYYRTSEKTTERKHVPKDSTPVGNDTWLAPDKSLWLADGEKSIATDVSSANSLINSDGTTRVTYITGGVARYRTSTTDVIRSQVPKDSTAVGNDTYLDSDGNLWLGDGEEALAKKVTSAKSLINTDGTTRVTYVTDGVAHYKSATSDVARTHVPKNSTVVGNDTYLAPDGSLWIGDSTTAFAKNVTSAVSLINSNSNTFVTYETKPVCK
ncbi:hypothetical protein C5C31_10945 [Rathayibacter rathayi]|uniref:hypothetical protein n=1 Tax=Rathayibacter rathayi TaxID=33887 RepID=UPI000CE8BB5B|nr:hypothetical protein [Rathayibacter rathayi]PPG69199.1 hypothetical protein C5C02_06590 [Rathayibacter rathayi]PPG75770.1 hypothetical protein C5C23_09470 [Rathayibacter rathayi]PPG95620.1 hypothetical protein C5C00_10095 [Rathayibacter rathayi]PPH20808.1 hypothetical protein C5C31_10945 [Rathayibacter rathayi]PPI75785.1 hypothetical protein C5E03_12545 [Rathayibacter rathayi]